MDTGDERNTENIKHKVARKDTSLVQFTNDFSIQSKLASAMKCYFSDNFLQYFVGKEKRRRNPLVNRGYYLRFKAVEAAFDSFFHILKSLYAPEFQIISLGAGFDSSYFRLKSQGKLLHCKYIEVDFPEVLAKKLSIIEVQESLKSLVGEYILDHDSNLILNTDSYVLLGTDLGDIKKLHSLCVEAQVDFNVPTFFLAECSIAYMSVNESSALIGWIKANFPNSSFAVYEQVYPKDAFGIVMLRHFLKLGSPLNCIETYHDLKSQRNRFLDMGWTICTTKDMDEFYISLPDSEKKRIQALELFDEYEAWQLKCCHYMLLWAAQGSLAVPPKDNLYPTEIEDANEVEWCATEINFKKIDTLEPLHRFGHRVCYFENGRVFIAGGFGVLSLKHQRLEGLSCYNIESQKLHKTTIIYEEDVPILGQRMFHSMVRLKDGIFIFGGRCNPEYPNDTAILFHSFLDITVGNNNSENNEVVEVLTQCRVISFLGEYPSARWRHTATAVMVNGVENVFLFGGFVELGSPERDCYLLDTVTWMWNDIPLQKYTPSKRHSCSSVPVGSKVYVSCGMLENDQASNSVYCFYADRETWHLMDVIGLFPRYSHTSHVWKHYLILVGGVNNYPDNQPFLAMINLMNMCASEFRQPGQDPEYPIMLSCHESVLYKEKIVIMGGGTCCFSFGNHFNKKVLEIDLKSIEEHP